MRRLILPLTLFLFPTLLCAEVVEDDFDDGNDEGWTRGNPLEAGGGMAQWTFPNGNSYRMAAGVSPAPGLLGPARCGSYRDEVTYEDAVYVAADLIAWDESQEQDIGLLALVSEPGLGTLDGYALTYDVDAGGIFLSRLVDEQPAETVTSAPGVMLTEGESYRFILQAFRGQFLVEVYANDDPADPLVVLLGFDDAYRTGFCGLFNSGGADDAATGSTFDNYRSSSDTDVDLDGLTDEWEFGFFEELFFSGLDDNDEDGLNNEYEFLTGTDPTDAGSRFALSGAGRSDAELFIRFPVIPDRTYTLQTSSNLVDWTTREDADFSVEDTTGTLRVADGGAPALFGRVVVARE